MLDGKTLTDAAAVQLQGGNIRAYDNYILERARAFRDTKIDHVRNGIGRLKRLSVDKGLLRETESVQHQIRACLRCDVCPPLWHCYAVDTDDSTAAVYRVR